MYRKVSVCLFVLAVFLSASSAFAVDQLLTNPGFEDGLTNWNGSYLDAGGTCSVDTTEFHSGLQSLKTIAGTTSSFINGARQYGPGTGWALPITSSVTMSAWIKVPTATTSNKFRYRFYIHYIGGTKVVGPYDITQNVWVQYSTTFSTLLTPIDWAAVQVYGYTTSTPTSNFIYYIDDVILSTTSHVISASSGTGGTISPAGNKYVLDAGSQTYTFTPNYGYGIATVLVDGINDPVAVSTGTYTFSGITADHTIAVSYAMITPYTISGNVAAAAGGGATVSFKSAANAVPSFTTTTNTSGNYSLLVPSVTWYACASQTGFIVSADQTLNVSGPMPGVNFTLAASTRNIPKMESMILGVNTDSLTMPSGDPIPTWPTLYPVSGSLTPLPILPPTLMTVTGAKWENNTVANLDGFRFGTSYWPVGEAKQSIPCSGATIVASVRPDRSGGDNLNFRAIVNIFHSRLCLVVQNLSGLVGVRRNTGTGSATTWSTYALPDLTGAILSLVAQPDGSYVVYADGNQIMTGPATAEGLTALVPGVLSNTEGAYDTFIDIGRTDTDAWSVFNGGISDVYIYNTALSTADRTALETDIRSNRAASFKITASAEAGGSISPSGNVIVDYGMPKTFTITPSDGYGIATVLVDSINDPAAVSSGTYTFNSVTADHTIVATFYALTPHTVTASAGSNGVISPSGAVIVFEGKSQVFTITPSFDYDIATVLVDGINNPAAVSSGTYTFTNVTANHTIAATFAAKPEYAVSGQVTDSLSALGVPFAKVYISRTANASVSPFRMATADVDGNFSITLFDATWYMCASHETHATSADQTVTVTGGPISGLSIVLVGNGRNIPAKDKLLFSALTSALPPIQDASTGPWAVDHPLGLAALTMMATPTVDLLDVTIPWVLYNNPEIPLADDGFMVMGPLTRPTTIPCTGATIVVVAKPVRTTTSVKGSLVNIFRQNLTLSIRNDTGQVVVLRNASNINNINTSAAVIPEEKTVLTLVVQTGGAYKVYANGVMIMDVAYDSQNNYGDFLAFVPQQSGTESTKRHINIGRSNVDIDTYFNGDIGDVFVYKTALTDAERIALQDDLGAKFGIPITHYTTVSGKVTLDDGVTPIQGATIIYIGSDYATTLTDAEGKYSINVVTESFVQISASKEYFGVSYPVEGAYYYDSLTAPLENIDFRLTSLVVPVANLADLKLKAGTITPVLLTGNVTVVSKGNGLFFVGEDQYKGCIKVVGADAVTAGDFVTGLMGLVTVDSYNQYTITLGAPVSTATTGNAIKTVGVNNKSAKTDAKLLTNLVKVWGLVGTGADYTIDDGYGNPITVKAGVATVPTGVAVITGVLWTEDDGSIVLYQTP